MKNQIKNLIVIFNLFCLSNLVYSQSISGGGWHSLIICPDSIVQTCGYNAFGQLGDGTIINKSTPVQVNGLTGIISVGGGWYYSLFLKNNGTVWACGYNNSGQLGDGTTIDKSTPVQVSPVWGGSISAISTRLQHSIYLKNDGTVWTCGLNNNGQLGDGTIINRSIPVKINGLINIIAIAAGANHSIFLKNDGTVWACGDNNLGQLGDGTMTDQSNPIQISGLTGIIAVAAGSNHSLFLKSDSTVWGCGRNVDGALGDGTATAIRSTPVQVSGLNSITAVAAGWYHSLFLKKNGTVWACGGGGFGQLGDGTSTDKFTPIQISSLTNITEIAGGEGHSLFKTNTGSIWACGDNGYGHLCDGTTISKATPIQATGLCSIVSIEENSNTNNISIYPNPCNEQFLIELSSFKNTTAEIYNLQGQLLLSTALHSNKTIMQLNNVTTGIYLVKIKNQQGVLVKKIIKN